MKTMSLIMPKSKNHSRLAVIFRVPTFDPRFDDAKFQMIGIT